MEKDQQVSVAHQIEVRWAQRKNQFLVTVLITVVGFIFIFLSTGLDKKWTNMTMSDFKTSFILLPLLISGIWTYQAFNRALIQIRRLLQKGSYSEIINKYGTILPKNDREYWGI